MDTNSGLLFSDARNVKRPSNSFCYSKVIERVLSVDDTQQSAREKTRGDLIDFQVGNRLENKR